MVPNTKKPPTKDNPLRRWQEMLSEKLEEPLGDREVIFAMDKMGNCGKSWFAEMCEERHGKCHTVGADKCDDMSCQLPNQIIENGPPNVIFMDAPHARAACAFSPWLEEIKNAKIILAKNKSKMLHLPHCPHMAVMMNEFPRKLEDLNEKCLSDDRCICLLAHEDGSGAEWLQGHRCDEGGAMAPGFKLTSCDTIQTTVQQRSNQHFLTTCRQPSTKRLSPTWIKMRLMVNWQKVSHPRLRHGNTSVTPIESCQSWIQWIQSRVCCDQCLCRVQSLFCRWNQARS